MLQDGYRLAVGIILLNAEGYVYAFQRTDYPTQWQCPEGGMEEGETAEEAALRELQEEVGILPEAIELVAKTQEFIRYEVPDAVKTRHQVLGQAKQFFVYRLLQEAVTFDFLQETHPEFQAVKLVRMQELIELVPFFKRNLYYQLQQEFQKILR